jgi:hypothetical protein
VPPRVRLLLVLVVAGALLVGGGLVLALRTPRADAPSFGTPVAAAVTPPPTSVPTTQQPAPSPPPPPPSSAAPVALELPTMPDAVPLVPVGALQNGALQLPERPSVLGWFAAGAVPGQPAGTAVVAGHVDSAEFGAGPLETLFDLHQGDVLTVADASGGAHRYTVASRTSYPKSGLPPELFRTDGPPQLALVTCGGAFDERTGQYADNVVVLAVPVS